MSTTGASVSCAIGRTIWATWRASSGGITKSGRGAAAGTGLAERFGSGSSRPSIGAGSSGRSTPAFGFADIDGVVGTAAVRPDIGSTMTGTGTSPSVASATIGRGVGSTEVGMGWTTDGTSSSCGIAIMSPGTRSACVGSAGAVSAVLVSTWAGSTGLTAAVAGAGASGAVGSAVAGMFRNTIRVRSGATCAGRTGASGSGSAGFAPGAGASITSGATGCWAAGAGKWVLIKGTGKVGTCEAGTSAAGMFATIGRGNTDPTITCSTSSSKGVGEAATSGRSGGKAVPECGSAGGASSIIPLGVKPEITAEKPPSPPSPIGAMGLAATGVSAIDSEGVAPADVKRVGISRSSARNVPAPGRSAARPPAPYARRRPEPAARGRSTFRRHRGHVWPWWWRRAPGRAADG
jgi:hypothetical protein